MELKGIGKHSAVIVLAIMLVLVLCAPLLSPVLSTVVRPYSSGECEECHTGFEPFKVKPDSPTEVPNEYEFEAGLLLENPWTHELKDIIVELDISSMPYLEFTELTTMEDQELNMEGTVPGGGRTTHQIEITERSTGLTVDLSWNSPILFFGDVDLTLRGPSGGSWNSDTAGTTESIHVSESELKAEGPGMYEIGVESETGLRSVTYTINGLIENRASTEVSQVRIDSIGSLGEQRVKFKLRSYEKGEGTISYRVVADAYYAHEGRGTDLDTYEETGTMSLTVGEDFTYNRATSSVSSIKALWITGRIFGFISVALYLTSFMTGGVSKRLKKAVYKRVKKARQWHCVISFGALLSVIVHIATLYSGVYSGTWRGIYLGGAALLLMTIVSLTGIFRDSLVRSIGDRNWRRVHFWSSIAIILLFMIHAVLQGTDLAFLRVW